MFKHLVTEPDCFELFKIFDQYFTDNLDLNPTWFFKFGLDENHEFKFNEAGKPVIEQLREITSQFIKEFWENDNVPDLKEDYWKIEIQKIKKQNG